MAFIHMTKDELADVIDAVRHRAESLTEAQEECPRIALHCERLQVLEAKLCVRLRRAMGMTDQPEQEAAHAATATTS